MKKVLKSPVFWGMLSLFLVFGYLYVKTLPSGPVGLADSDELLSVGYHLGVAHPPGYPLYILMLYGFTHLPLSLSIAEKGHLLSVLLSSLSLGVVFASCWQILRFLSSKIKGKSFWLSKGGSWVIAWVSTSLLGASFLFWQYSVVTEVFALNNLFVAILIYFLVAGLLDSNRITTKWWVGLAMWMGLGLAHHQTLILMIPALGVMSWWYREKFNIHIAIRMIFVGLMFFLGSFLLLIWYESREAPVSWYMDSGINGMIRMVLRQEFTGTIVATGEQTNAYFSEISWDKFSSAVPNYWEWMVKYFGWITLGVGVLGLKFVFDINKRLLGLILVGYLSMGLFLVGMMGWPEHIGSQAILSRHYLIGFMWLPLVVAAGWLLILIRLKKGLDVITKKSVWGGLVLFLLLVTLTTWRIRTVQSQIDFKTANTVSNYYAEVLERLEPNSLIACFTDTPCFAFLYQQNVLGKRSDVVVIPGAYPLVRDQLEKQSDLRNFVYKEDPYRRYDYLTWNVDKRDVYVIDLNPAYYDLLGINNGFMFYVPFGNYGKLTKELPENMKLSDLSLGRKLLNTEHSELSQLQRWMKANAARQHVFNSVIYIKAGYRDLARDELNLASNLFYQMPGLEDVEAIRKEIEFSDPDARFKPGAKVPDVDILLEAAEEQIERERLDLALLFARGAVTGNPEHVGARLELANIYLQMGENQLARWEYLNVLRLDSENEQALEAIELFR